MTQHRPQPDEHMERKMKKRSFSPRLTAAIVATQALLLAAPVGASSHRETPFTAHNPCADNADVYSWVEEVDGEKRLVLIRTIQPLHEPGQGNWQNPWCTYDRNGDGIRYRFNIAVGTGPLNPKYAVEFRFHRSQPSQVDVGALAEQAVVGEDGTIANGSELLGQLSGAETTYDVHWIEFDDRGRAQRSDRIGQSIRVSPANIGPRTDRLAYQVGGATFGGAPGDSTVGLFDGDFMKSFVSSLDNGGVVWAGEADDPFYLDEDAVFDVLNLRTLNGMEPKDVFAGFNINAMAVSVPVDQILPEVELDGEPGDDSLLGIWVTTERRKINIARRYPRRTGQTERQRARFRNRGSMKSIGGWVQIGRQGLPLINAAVIGAQDQEVYLRTPPTQDLDLFGGYFLNPVLVRDLNALGVYSALVNDLGLVPAEGFSVEGLSMGRVDIVETINLAGPGLGDHNLPIAPGHTGYVLRCDVDMPASFPNCRSLVGPAPNKEQTDVSDILVTLIATGFNVFTDAERTTPFIVPDGVNSNDVDYLDSFPYVGVPHEGLSGGHGAPAP